MERWEDGEGEREPCCCRAFIFHPSNFGNQLFHGNIRSAHSDCGVLSLPYLCTWCLGCLHNMHSSFFLLFPLFLFSFPLTEEYAGYFFLRTTFLCPILLSLFEHTRTVFIITSIDSTPIDSNPIIVPILLPPFSLTLYRLRYLSLPPSLPPSLPCISGRRRVFDS